MVTLRTIAERCGVDVSTVSKVIHGREIRVTEETRSKILAAAKELNYRPNALARSLRLRKSGAIVMALRDTSNFVYPEIIDGAQEAAERHETCFFLLKYTSGETAGASLISLVQEGRVNHHFLACWRQIDPVGSRHGGLISLTRRHQSRLKSEEQAARLMAYLDERPWLKAIYDFKQRLCELLLQKHCNQRKCQTLAKRLVHAIDELRNSKLPCLVQLGETLHSWSEEIATMWRFTKNNGITEGFHNKMETLKRRAYGFRNFENYRLRVRVTCS